MDINDSVYNCWRNTGRWPLAGIPPLAVDARIVAVWLPLLISSVFFWPAALVTVYLLTARFLKIPSRLLLAYARHRLRGRRLAALPARFSRGLLPMLLVAAFGAASPPADAAFQVVVPEQKEAPEDNLQPAIPKSLDDEIEGYGHDVALADAARALLPPGWESRFNPSAIGKRKVHWRANGRSVREVLADIANQAGARFDADENAGLLRFSPLPVGMRMTAAGMVRDTSTRRYTLRAGHMLSEELVRWARIAGFQFQWRIKEDYPIDADAVFEGYLPDVIRDVFETYRAQGGLLGARYISGSTNNVLAFVPRHR